VDGESRKQAIEELLGIDPDDDNSVLRATGRFAVLCIHARFAPQAFERMEDAGWAFVANVGSGCPMFRKSR
jgi:hypothetical protein